MARMHSRKKGKSKSTKPTTEAKLAWIRYKPKEVELLITKVAKEGLAPSQVGMYMRDVYGIPCVKSIIGKNLAAFLKEKKLVKDIPEDLLALIRRFVTLKKHLEDNKKDEPAQRGLTLTESKIKRLVKYYKAKEMLPSGWKLDQSKIQLYIE